MSIRVALMVAAIAAASPALAGPSSLVGAWKLVETRQVMADGRVRSDPDLGARPTGYMIYDPSGRMCTVFNDGDAPRWAAEKPTDAEVRASFNGLVSYCATYEVDAARKVLVTHIDVAQTPNHVGVTRERRFELNGDTLILYPRPLPAGATEWSVRLRRVRR